MSPAPTAVRLAAACRTALTGVPGIAQHDVGGLSLALADGRRTWVRLHIEDGWAELTAGLPAGQVALDPWNALIAAAAVEGVARLWLTPGAPALECRADVALEDDVDPAPRLADACNDLCSLVAALSGRPETHGPCNATPAAEASERSDARVDLCARLSETGWAFVERDPDRLAVDLSIPDRFQQAILMRSAGGRTLARATLAIGSAPTLASRLAIGVLLLTTSGVVRVVRPGIAIEGRDVRLFVEAYLDRDPAAGEMDAALRALATACRITGRETRALVDERVARIYLAARGWAA